MSIIKNNNNDKQKVAFVIDFVSRSGGIEYTRQKMIEYRNEAIEILNSITDANEKIHLQNLVDYVVERKN
jgi:octaprenyl-diphosphate synthase